jgi:predicted glycogen debranching enzyme
MSEPWPSVTMRGESISLELEWLHTNGGGAYAMSTLALMHTRRHHGALVAALEPPLGRYVILSHLETVIDTGERSYRLATHQFPGVAPTHGYKLLEQYDQDPIPRWTYRLGKRPLVRTLCLERGKNCVVWGYTWHGPAPARISTKPLMPLRPSDQLTREHGAVAQRVTLRSGAVEIRPLAALPPITFIHEGMFVGSPDWWRRFEYAEDRARGLDWQEDLWTPGTFEWTLEPGRTSYLAVAVGAAPEREPHEIVAETVRALEPLDAGEDHPPSVRSLWVAAEQFRAVACETPAIVAGYPAQGVWARDLLIALPGVCLVPRDLEAARGALRTVIRRRVDGLVPRRIDEWGGAIEPGAPDASLWLFEAARMLIDAAGVEDPFVRQELYPALREVFARVQREPRDRAWLTRDGLLANGAAGEALTWMDGRVAGVPLTPRAGLAVEQQALWSKACETLALLGGACGDATTAEAAQQACSAARGAFKARFWCEAERYAYDCVSEERDGPSAWVDASIRPNALLALAVDPELFEHWQATAILARVKRDLLTPRGVRTLDRAHPAYSGHFEGSPDERERARHQGTAWPYLLGFYARAALRLQPDDFELRIDLRELLEQAAHGGPVLGQVPQLADGDAPHRPRGYPAQAWSVGELLRALVWDLEL